jgi:hypothetical protein
MENRTVNADTLELQRNDEPDPQLRPSRLTAEHFAPNFAFQFPFSDF